MKNRWKAPILAAALLAGGLIATSQPAAAMRWNASVVFGVPAPPAARAELELRRPSPSHVWVRGYYDWDDAHRSYRWIAGSWVLPPHVHAAWVAPRFEVHTGRRCFVRGHWRW